MKRKHLSFIAMAIISTIFFVNCVKQPEPYVSTPFDTSDPVEMQFVLVESGTFTMGGEAEYFVVLDSFYISKHEITQAQWIEVMGDENHDDWNNTFGWGNNFPAYRISFDDVKEFISRINSSQNEYFYSLPTEAEWEYAAKGGKLSQNNTYSGSNDIENVAWYKDNSEILYHKEGTDFKARLASHIIGLKAANELGLFDMSGNVGEICSDFTGAIYEPGNTYNNPTGAKSGSSHIVRGGSFSDADNICRVVARSQSVAPSQRNPNVGFRLVRKPYIAVESLTLDEHKINLFSGETQQLSAEILPVKASVQNVIWSSSKAAAARVDENGLVTAVSPNRTKFTPDTAMIYATTIYKGVEVKDSCMVIVGVIDVTSISLNEIALELYAGDSAQYQQEFQLIATILPDNADFKNVVWTSSDEETVTVNNTGRIKAKAVGNATITAATYNGGFTETCNVSVVQHIKVTGVEISETDIELSVGQTFLLSANVLPAGASVQGLIWSTDNVAVASVSSSGLVTANAIGTTKIAVKTQERNFEKICNVKVQ